MENITLEEYRNSMSKELTSQLMGHTISDNILAQFSGLRLWRTISPQELIKLAASIADIDDTDLIIREKVSFETPLTAVGGQLLVSYELWQEILATIDETPESVFRDSVKYIPKESFVIEINVDILDEINIYEKHVSKEIFDFMLGLQSFQFVVACFHELKHFQQFKNTKNYKVIATDLVNKKWEERWHEKDAVEFSIMVIQSPIVLQYLFKV